MGVCKVGLKSLREPAARILATELRTLSAPRLQVRFAIYKHQGFKCTNTRYLPTTIGTTLNIHVCFIFLYRNSEYP